jgi:hypothetical protein
MIFSYWLNLTSHDPLTDSTDHVLLAYPASSPHTPRRHCDDQGIYLLLEQRPDSLDQGYKITYKIIKWYIFITCNPILVL